MNLRIHKNVEYVIGMVVISVSTGFLTMNIAYGSLVFGILAIMYSVISDD